MNVGNTGRRGHQQRIAILWICIGLFFLRVIGQVEVLLLSPPWLPPMNDWYSGLLPYPLLLPAQIALLMLMSVLVVREMRTEGLAFARPERWRTWVRRFALVYFVVMVSRLAIQLFRGADDVIAAGGIPVAFHWVLALFLLVLSRTDRH
ncbi:MAG TPA: hypothetical protein VGD45_12155 [Steroidobacter sp.]|uniref:hypothetical protein n=1 Tax=Steroidobacter sp. TaxID=1978227 RepID=UPI002EDAC3E9